jgi:hypothetical protein
MASSRILVISDSDMMENSGRRLVGILVSILLHGINNGQVTGASAQISGDCDFDFLVGRVGMGIE